MLYEFVTSFSGPAIYAVILGIGYFIYKNESGNGHGSLSAYAAVSRSQQLLLFVALIILSAPLYLWFLWWVLPRFSLPAWLPGLLFLSYAAHVILIIFPLIPAKGRRALSNLIHLAAGSFLALVMLFMTALLALSLPPHSLARLILYGCLVYFISCVAGYLLVRNTSKFLSFEIGYILLFGVVILTTAIVGNTT